MNLERNRVELTQDELNNLLIRHKINLENDIKKETYKKQIIQDRLDQGKSINVITKTDLVKILDLWFDNSRGVLSKCFNSVYEEDKYNPNKEVDWAKNIPKSLSFGKPLLSAIKSSTHKSAKLIRDSVMYDNYKTTTVFMQKTLTWRIKRLNEILETEERILKLELENLELRKAMNITTDLASWKVEALQLLANGHKQQDVAAIVGKSLATIKRLVKKNKMIGGV